MVSRYANFISACHSCSDKINCDLMLSEPQHDKTNNLACASVKDSDQPWHLFCLIRVFAVYIELN